MGGGEARGQAGGSLYRGMEPEGDGRRRREKGENDLPTARSEENKNNKTVLKTNCAPPSSINDFSLFFFFFL